MPMCVVKWCRSHTDMKNTGITFHSFSSNEVQRGKWTAAVRLERQENEWSPSKCSKICSIHFRDEDKYVTNKGICRLIKSAVPICTMVSLQIPSSSFTRSTELTIESREAGDLMATNSNNMQVQEDLAPKVVKNINKTSDTDETPDKTTSSLLNVCPEPLDQVASIVSECCHDVPSCSFTEELSLKRKLAECPNCKYRFYVETDFLGKEHNSSKHIRAEEVLKERCTPISVPSSEIESVFNTPRKHRLKTELQQKTALAKKRLSKIKNLQRKNKRLLKKNVTLKDIVTLLKKKGLGESNLNTAFSGFASDIISTIKKKRSTKGRTLIKFSPAIKKFALTLNYYSPAGYKYVRTQLLSCLPHPSTISKWYQSIDGKPGFTTESFRALRSKFCQSEKRLSCLMVDEMAIRQQKIFNGIDVDGLVTHGPPEEIATQVYVLMLVSLEDSFKLPLGFFFVNGFSAEQRHNVIKLCLEKCHEVGAEVVSLTFDGCASNLAAAKLLGCNFEDTENLKTDFQHPVTKKPVVVILDPCHMVKLIRNTFEAKKTLIDLNGRKIEWKYIQNLKNVQDNIGLHFGNKLTQRHLQFRNNVMNVKLATQTLSNSVATALKLCSKDLNLVEFHEADATINFIEIINDLFDILNTRSLGGHGFKKPFTIDRKDELFDFLDRTSAYLRRLKISVQMKKTLKIDGEKTVTTTTSQKILTNTQSKTGFLGLLICISSLKLLFIEIVEKQMILKFILPYKFSQDHLELFFGVIRNHGRCNNNPNARQFMGIYKKTLLNLELRSKFTGNCIPLEDIPILNCSSAINKTTTGFRHKLQENVVVDVNDIFNTEMENCVVLSNMLDVERHLPETVEQIIGYIGGFVAKKLQKKIECSACTNLLLASGKLYFHKLISLKDFGGLAYPSVIVFKICSTSETLLRQLINQDKCLSRAHNLPVIVIQCFRKIIERSDILTPLKESHAIDSNHDVMLLKTIIEEFLRVRLHYIARKDSLLNSARHKLNKLIIFRGT